MLPSVENPNAGDLKIVRINKVHGSCSGLEEIFIFVEQVNKSKYQLVINCKLIRNQLKFFFLLLLLRLFFFVLFCFNFSAWMQRILRFDFSKLMQMTRSFGVLSLTFRSWMFITNTRLLSSIAFIPPLGLFNIFSIILFNIFFL